MRIEADKAVCVGAGMCVLTAPEVFDQDDEDGRVVLLESEPSPSQHRAAVQAVELCPSGALTYSRRTPPGMDDEGGKRRHRE